MIKKDFLIGIASLNELENLVILINKILLSIPDIPILIVDDSNLNYGTFESLFNFNSRVISIYRSQRLGVGSAHQAMLKYAKENEFKNLVTMDADETHSVLDLKKMIDYHGNSGLVIGSRFMTGGGMQNWELKRRIATRTAHYITWKFSGVSLDFTSGIRRYSFEHQSFDAVENLEYNDYRFFYLSTFWALQEKVHISQIAVNLQRRNLGESKMSTAHALKLIFSLFTDSFNFFIRNKW